MLPHLETVSTVHGIERELVLRRAERKARLIEAVALPRSAPALPRIGQANPPLQRFARAVRPLRWIVRASGSLVTPASRV